MQDRGKAVEVSSGNWVADYSSSSDLPCRKHPSSSSSGICAYCLKDRLIKLVCSDCGEQRLSSCSCSDVSSSNRNSCTIEVGSVGRISFLMENEKNEPMHLISKPLFEDKTESVVFLQRSRSSSVEVKRSGLWKLGKLFRKKRDKELGLAGRNSGGFDEKGEMWVFDCNVGVTRSRSVCGIRGGGAFDGSEGGGSAGFSGVESVKSGRLSGARKSGFGGEEREHLSSVTESGYKGVKKGGILEFESGFNGANKRTALSVSEGRFDCREDSGFIDLNLGISSESKPEFSCHKLGDRSVSSFGGLRSGDFSEYEPTGSFSYLRGDENFSDGKSCRIVVNDKGIKRCKKSLNVWKWIFRPPPSGKSGTKTGEEIAIKL